MMEHSNLNLRAGSTADLREKLDRAYFGECQTKPGAAVGRRETHLDAAVTSVCLLDGEIKRAVERLEKLAEKLGGPRPGKACGTGRAGDGEVNPGTLRVLALAIDSAGNGAVELHSLISKFEESL